MHEGKVRNIKKVFNDTRPTCPHRIRSGRERTKGRIIPLWIKRDFFLRRAQTNPNEIVAFLCLVRDSPSARWRFERWMRRPPHAITVRAISTAMKGQYKPT